MLSGLAVSPPEAVPCCIPLGCMLEAARIRTDATGHEKDAVVAHLAALPGVDLVGLDGWQDLIETEAAAVTGIGWAFAHAARLAATDPLSVVLTAAPAAYAESETPTVDIGPP